MIHQTEGEGEGGEGKLQKHWAGVQEKIDEKSTKNVKSKGVQEEKE